MSVLAVLAAALGAGVIALAVPAVAAGGDNVPGGAAPAGALTNPVGTGGVGVQAGSGYAVQGIDVSHWQGGINWASVAAAGIDFAYAKATEGTGYTDTTYGTNRSGARANGILFGAYHFARPDQGDPRGQADRLVNASGYSQDGKTLPPMLDIEWASGQPACFNLSASAMVSWISSFLDQVRVRTGQKAMIYTNPNWWNPCTGSSTAFGSYPLFHSRYDSSPGTLPAGWSTWTLWQYTSSGTVPGVSGNVDRDAFNGTLDALKALCAGGTPVDGQLYRDGTGTIAVIVGGAPARFTSMAELTETGYGTATWTQVPTGWFDDLPGVPHDGALMRRATDGDITLVAGGAGYHLTYGDWTALGKPASINTPRSYIDAFGAVPADGTYLRSIVDGAIVIVAGGAAYHVNASEYAQLGSPAFTNVPAAWIATFGAVPADGTYLRSIVDGTIYVMASGAKRALTYDEWVALGRPASVNVPVGFLESIPDQ